MGLFEGVFPHSCPPGADWPCVATALRREIDISTGSEKRRGSDLMEVKAPEGVEILYRGEPAWGPDRSCVVPPMRPDRDVRAPLECVDGKVRPVGRQKIAPSVAPGFTI